MSDSSAKLLKFELNHTGVGQLLKSESLADGLEQYATKMSDMCGEGYTHDRKLMGTRYIASAYTDTYEAMVDNSENNTLLKALSNMR